jgi:hypothetical protein
MAQDVPVGVVVAFKKGSATDMDRYLSNTAELTIGNSLRVNDKENVISSLGKFFTDKKSNGFTVNHKGNRDESGFIIGTLNTADGDYRVNCYFKRLQNKYIIHQIRIDKIDG